MENDAFERIRRINEKISKLFKPSPAMLQILKQQEMFERANRPFAKLHEQSAMFDKLFNSEFSKTLTAQQTLLPVIEYLNSWDHETIRSAFIAGEAMKNHATTWGRTLKSLSDISDSTEEIPEPIYQKIDELASFMPSEPDSLDADSSNASEIHTPEDESQTTWSWSQLILFILAIWSAIYPLVQDYQDQIQDDKNQMIQEKQHDELIEKFDEFMIFLKPFIPTDQDDLESDSSNHPDKL
ncbi:hypothetical protein [Paenibacillus graminis]|uniref:hypothetical protein n=1 Tax=Paenibacillus graminis TaxID=189425 RepID=UPI002DB9756F|nr:hypothetical protein [Paenibacillus graminis]MEC0173242.1 hypothetical protein [Paenibacillus graminis]